MVIKTEEKDRKGHKQNIKAGHTGTLRNISAGHTCSLTNTRAGHTWT